MFEKSKPIKNHPKWLTIIPIMAMNNTDITLVKF